MSYIEIRVVFEHPQPETAAELIAAAFFELGLSGVVIEDPRLDPAEEWADDARPRPTAHAVAGYLPVDHRLEAARGRLEAELGRLADRIGLLYRLGARRVAEEQWAESWKAFFRPLKIGRRLVVKPSWSEYAAAAGEVVIEIDPGMAFGTGTHPTTALSAELIERFLAPGEAFLDVGTGSGILMAVAGKLGAGLLAGGDRDPAAVAIAAENLRRNAIPAERVRLACGHLAAPFRGRFDLVAANILSEVVLELLEDLPRVLRAGGLFVASGILAEGAGRVVERMRGLDFEILAVPLREGWAAVAGRRREHPAGGG